MASMLIDSGVLALLRCPVTGEPLELASPDLLEGWNRRIAAGDVDSRNGNVVMEPMENALVNQSRSLVIPVRNGIVILLDQELIPLSQLSETRNAS